MSRRAPTHKVPVPPELPRQEHMIRITTRRSGSSRRNRQRHNSSRLGLQGRRSTTSRRRLRSRSSTSRRTLRSLHHAHRARPLRPHGGALRLHRILLALGAGILHRALHAETTARPPCVETMVRPPHVGTTACRVGTRPRASRAPSTLGVRAVTPQGDQTVRADTGTMRLGHRARLQILAAIAHTSRTQRPERRR